MEGPKPSLSFVIVKVDPGQFTYMSWCLLSVTLL